MGGLTITTTVTVWLSLIILFISFCSGDEVADGENGREVLEIIIGGGGGGYGPSPAPETPDCPPPPPPPVPVCPTPSPPPPPPTPSPPPPPPPSPPPPTPSPPPPPPPPPPPTPSPPPPPRPPPRSPPPPPTPSPPPPRPLPPRSPPPPKPPARPVFPSLLVKKSQKVILRFKKKIFHDNCGYTKTWDEHEGDVCNKYKGFACDRRPDNNITAVASIDFNGCGFAGKDYSNIDLSEFLAGMVDLAILHVNSNNFSGKIPDLSNIPYLYEFDVSNNKYSGDFPPEVLRATNISFLDLRFNSFGGTVPPAIFSTAYDVLFINNNNFKSSLPDLKSKTALYLTFANNEFTGNIPKSIGDAEKLVEVLFLNNSLNGCLPYEIGKLKKATVFDVGFNNLTGPIPHSFSCLKKMELLNLAVNSFYGAVPEAVCGLPNLANLTLSHNYFTQVGPKCRELIKKKVLDMRMNCIIDLDHQRSAKECAKFFHSQPSCPDPRSFFYVPCENVYKSEGSSDDGLLGSELAGSTAPTPSPRAYGALAPSW